MRNITISIPDDVYRDARVFAAQHDTSVSAVVRDYLQALSDRDATRARLAERRRGIVDSLDKSFSARHRLSRDEIHERGVR